MLIQDTTCQRPGKRSVFLSETVVAVPWSASTNAQSGLKWNGQIANGIWRIAEMQNANVQICEWVNGEWVSQVRSELSNSGSSLAGDGSR